jgi:hypothetical protein
MKLPVPQLVKKFFTFCKNPTVHYYVQNSPKLLPIMNQNDPVHIFLSFCKIVFNIILPSTPRSSIWFPSFRTRHQTPVRISLFPFVPHTRPIPCALLCSAALIGLTPPECQRGGALKIECAAGVTLCCSVLRSRRFEKTEYFNLQVQAAQEQSPKKYSRNPKSSGGS